jgi:hypothetical protein
LNHFTQIQPQISEFAFASLFGYKISDKPKLSHLDTALLIKLASEPSNKEILLPPIGSSDVTQIVDAMDQANAGAHTICGLTRSQAESLTTRGFAVVEDRGNWDYVYLVSDLAELKGTKYYSKRKDIKQCLAAHKCEYHPITQDSVDRCLRLEEEWCNLMDCGDNPSLQQENWAIRETFLHYHELGLFGAIVLVDSRLEAFTVAERLNDNTAVVHFEKANPKIRGLYQVINQWFCQKALADYEYVNREQDLGEPGLRRAKLSYRPHHMVEKYIAMRTAIKGN